MTDATADFSNIAELDARQRESQHAELIRLRAEVAAAAARTTAWSRLRVYLRDAPFLRLVAAVIVAQLLLGWFAQLGVAVTRMNQMYAWAQQADKRLLPAKPDAAQPPQSPQPPQ